MRKVSLKEYAEKYNTVKTRRGNKMSWAYLYRLIRKDLGCVKDTEPKDRRDLWFKYELEGEKKRIWIILPK